MIYECRDGKASTFTFEEFKKRREHETAKFVTSIKTMPEVRILDNNRTARELGSQIINEVMNVHRLIDPSRIYKPGKQRALKELYCRLSPR